MGRRRDNYVKDCMQEATNTLVGRVTFTVTLPAGR